MYGKGLFSIRIAVMFFLIALAPSVFPQTYTILAEDEAGLWGQADGTGCGNDIVKAAFAASGVSVRLEITPYNRAKILVLKGKALACFGMSWSEELAGKVRFASVPIYSTTSLIFVRGSEAARYRSVDSLPAGTRVGTVLGYEYPVDFVRLVKAGILVPEDSPSEEQNLKKLALGRIDLAILNLNSLKRAENMMREAGVTGQVREAFALGGQGTFVGFAIGNPETPAAIKAFDEGMAKITSNGTLARIMATWMARQ